MTEKLKFSLQTLTLLIILGTIIILVDMAYTNLVLPKKTFYHKENLYQNYISELNKKEIKYIFFGDSHTFHDVNPEYIDNSYNYGTGAENYIKTYYKLRKMIYIDKIKLNTIILETDLHTFSTRLTDKTHLFNELEVYSKFTSLNEIKKIRKEDSLLKLWIEAKLPFISNGKEFGILLYKPELSEVSSLGWLKNKEDFASTNKTLVAQEVYRDTFEGQERFSNYSIDYFEKTLKLAKKNEINVILIKYPYAREYDKALKEGNSLSKEEYYKKIFQITNSSIEDYHILDYSQDFLDQDYLFGDPAHLNYKGSEILSKKLNEDLLKLGLKNNFKKEEIELPNYNNLDLLSYFGLFLIILELILILFIIRGD